MSNDLVVQFQAPIITKRVERFGGCPLEVRRQGWVLSVNELPFGSEAARELTMYITEAETLAQALLEVAQWKGDR